MSLSPPPNHQKLQDENGNVSDQWQEFFTFVFQAIRGVQSSGTTAQRPIKGLYVGRPYFDKTIGIPIWYNGIIWVKSDGTAA